MGAQVSLKAAPPLAERIATASDRYSKTGPWVTPNVTECFAAVNCATQVRYIPSCLVVKNIHWGWDKIAAIIQAAFSFISWMKIGSIPIQMFTGIYSKGSNQFCRHWFRSGSAPNMRQIPFFSNDCLVYWRMCASLGIDEFKCHSKLTSQSLFNGCAAVGFSSLCINYCAYYNRKNQLLSTRNKSMV